MTNDADWSLYTTRELALSLPANNDATGKPAITGGTLIGHTLTATKGTIADPDGLPTVFTYQWKRVDADGVSNPTNIGADAANYTLTTSDVGKRILVESQLHRQPDRRRVPDQRRTPFQPHRHRRRRRDSKGRLVLRV